MEMKSEDFLVSVDMITYNHEKFLAKAIEGVLMQETSFKYELIIANDCSPDNTKSVVEHFINNHPKGDVIKYYEHVNNIGMQSNAIFTLNCCKGKYIAICEGDDYWTDPYKLQKQVDFLESNSDYSVHYFNSNKIIIAQNFLETGAFGLKSKSFEFSDSFTNKKIGPTLTMMIKQESLFKNFDLLQKLMPNDAFIGDWPLEMICLLDGNGYFDAEVAGVYRVHDAGQILTLRKKYRRPRLLSEIIIYTAFLRDGSDKLSESERAFAKKKIWSNYFRIFTTEISLKYYTKFFKDFSVIFFR